MRCDEASERISLALDGALDGAEEDRVDEHLADCGSCRAFRASSLRVRQHLRYEVVVDVPDLEARVLDEVRATSPRPARARVRALRPSRWIAAAAAVLAGVVAGATFMGLRTREPDLAGAADLSGRILVAQQRVDGLRAKVLVTERGWHPQVPVRTYSGTLEYVAPESLEVSLADATEYPSKAWHRNDVTIVVDRDREWRSGPAACPRESQPTCTPAQPRVLGATAREPFPDASPAPLDLVVPVGSFAGGGRSVSLGERVVDGHDAVGVEVTVAQVAPLLDGILRSGNWRELHSTDRVRLWLDRARLVPLQLEVFAATSRERERWAARRGYTDDPGTPVLEVRLHGVRATARGLDLPPAPTGVLERAHGFRELPAEQVPAPIPTRLPRGMSAYRAGIVETPSGPLVAVRSWTDGRAWVKVRTTSEWPGGRLFGDLGAPVRVVSLGPAGLAYVGDGGRRVALHGAGSDVVVTGSVGEAALLRAAATLGVRGEQVPADWSEAGSATPDEAAVALAGILLPRELSGFAEPAIRIDGEVVTFALAGPGSRGFELVAARGSVLTPPIDVDAEGVEVRRTVGRYSPERGDLEWIERGITYSLRSDTLSLGELLRVATGLRRA